MKNWQNKILICQGFYGHDGHNTIKQTIITDNLSMVLIAAECQTLIAKWTLHRRTGTTNSNSMNAWWLQTKVACLSDGASKWSSDCFALIPGGHKAKSSSDCYECIEACRITTPGQGFYGHDVKLVWPCLPSDKSLFPTEMDESPSALRND